MEHRIGDIHRIRKVKLTQQIVGVKHIAHHRHQMLANTLDQAAIDKGIGGRVQQPELDTALFLNNLNIKFLVQVQQTLAVVNFTAAIEHRQRAVAKQPVKAALAGIQQRGDFTFGQNA